MGLLEEAKDLQTQQGPKCSISRLDPDTQDELAEALTDDTLQYEAISRALRARGHNIAAQTVSRHHQGHCSCPA